MRGCKSSGSVEYRTVVSPHAGTHENHNGLYVASQALGNDTMVARSVDDTTMVAHSPDVLQFINNDVPRVSHLTYHTEVPMWNVLTKNYLNNFDIEIQDHNASNLASNIKYSRKFQNFAKTNVQKSAKFPVGLTCSAASQLLPSIHTTCRIIQEIF